VLSYLRPVPWLGAFHLLRSSENRRCFTDGTKAADGSLKDSRRVRNGHTA
jgi:hypothetical protein